MYENARDQNRFSKKEFLYEISGLPGVYVPSLYDIEVDEDGYVADFIAHNGVNFIQSNVALDLVEHPIYSLWTSKKSCYEYDDYLSLMVAMGCNKKCPYCVVGTVQGARDGKALQINHEQVLRLALDRYSQYGTRIVKLFFSSAFSDGGDDINSSNLKNLLIKLNSFGLQAKTGSLNIKQADDELFELLKANGQADVTFAPETVEHLRPIIGKAYISDDKLFYLAEQCNKHNMSLKLYMLGGIPGETDRDTIMQADLINRIRRTLRRDLLLEIHYNPVFVKAQTPLQHFATPRPEEIRRKYHILKTNITEQPTVFVTTITDSMVYYQPLLSIGDFNSAKILAHLYKKKRVTEEDWKHAFVELGISDERYFKRKDISRKLPWQHIGYVDHDKMAKRSQSILNLESKRLSINVVEH
ncbi:hypothetical protein O3V59_22600 [Brevibacillus thermoruber]|uniref:Radical SAM core domain-containing protein n=1 Tax=Brevibacillus thermoruber TaxID=33942 RepID=A0A9X3Z5Q4_9BACL|nr:radical SAM protein [Brevibacillus thermoruber]MDA5111123.1 hypothetical protein [Brevibacillus thermoruber]